MLTSPPLGRVWQSAPWTWWTTGRPQGSDADLTRGNLPTNTNERTNERLITDLCLSVITLPYPALPCPTLPACWCALRGFWATSCGGRPSRPSRSSGDSDTSCWTRWVGGWVGQGGVVPIVPSDLT